MEGGTRELRDQLIPPSEKLDLQACTEWYRQLSGNPYPALDWTRKEETNDTRDYHEAVIAPRRDRLSGPTSFDQFVVVVLG